MKKFIILSLLILLSTYAKSSFSYTLYGVGKINSKAYNEAWDQFFDKTIKVHAGTNGSNATVRITYEMSLSQFGTDYSFKLDDNGYLKDNAYFERLLFSIDKSIEWSKIAKENKVSVNKIITEGDLCENSSDFEGVYCRPSFLSANEGYQTDLIILVRETADYALNDDKFYIDLENQIKLKDLLTNSIQEKIFYSIEQEKKGSDLFN